MSCVILEKKGKYIYIKCKKCGHVLFSNESMSISDCEHFQVVMSNDRIEIVPK